MYDLKTQNHPPKFHWFLPIQIKKHLCKDKEIIEKIVLPSSGMAVRQSLAQ